ncbi:hypothetical protein V6B16_13030 [Salinimicrobium catena]|uniref:hypothetical protein n=1 Tax=Salinimicrobium catena TaxID=390640 RepID=UPI002FE4AA40
MLLPENVIFFVFVFNVKDPFGSHAGGIFFYQLNNDLKTHPALRVSRNKFGTGSLLRRGSIMNNYQGTEDRGKRAVTEMKEFRNELTTENQEQAPKIKF